MSTKQPSRILAVEIRAARLGYAMFETHEHLRDFGTKSFDSAETARLRLSSLLLLFRPSILVLSGAGTRYPRDMPSRKVIVRIAKGEAKKLSIPVDRVSEKIFKSFFENYSCRNKYEVAAVLAGWFPELEWRVPRTPKFYEPEPRSMLYFDSIALGVAYQKYKSGKTRTCGDGILSPASK